MIHSHFVGNQVLATLQEEKKKKIERKKKKKSLGTTDAIPSFVRGGTCDPETKETFLATQPVPSRARTGNWIPWSPVFPPNCCTQSQDC